jgi:putative NADH-flavin reductase
MTTLIIGANGKIGQLVCQQGSALGMDLLGMVRNTEQAPILKNWAPEPWLLIWRVNSLTHSML